VFYGNTEVILRA